MKLEDIRGLDIYYLATPFTRYEMGLDAACYDATAIAAKLVDKGFRVFPPITAGHNMAKVGYLDPVDDELWTWYNRGFVEKADACIVACLPGWEESDGVAHEIATFLMAGKPVVYLDVESI